MKQLFQNLRNGETVVMEVPVPTPGPGRALVRTAASLVSAGTERSVADFAGKSLLGKIRARPDLVDQVLEKARRDGLMAAVRAARLRLEDPMPLGYSSSGTIVALGPEMPGFQVGDRVACAGGGYAVHAEFAVVPKNLLARLPDGVDFESAAFTTLGSIALHGFRLAECGVGDRVAVIGLGLLGSLTSGIALAAGCQVLGVDMDLGRVRFIERMGAEAVLRERAEEAALTFSSGLGCDAVLICADTRDSDPVELAGSIARDRARVVAVGAVGMDIPRKLYYQKELSFQVSRSYGPGRYDPQYEEGGADYPAAYVRWTEGRNMEAFVGLLASQRLQVRPMISHHFSIDDSPHAYDLITGKKKEPYLGIILGYPEGSPVRRTIQLAPGEGIRSEPRPAGGSRALRLGVLGAGNFSARVALPAIRKVDRVGLVGIASASGGSAQSAGRRFGFRYATSDEMEIIGDAQVDALAIFTRHNLHARQVVQALAAGKHVYCEKPLALNELELEEIYQALGGASLPGRGEDAPGGSRAESPDSAGPQPAAAAAARHETPVLTVGYNRRFAPLSRDLAGFLEGRDEPLAAVYRVNAGPLPPDHWLQDPEIGGGRIVGEACHFIDYLAFLAGGPPLSVAACGLPDAGRYREDNLIITLEFPDGSAGAVVYLANGDRSFPKERLEVFSGGRVAVLDDFRSLETHAAGRSGRRRLAQDKGHQAAWEAFTRTILDGGPPPIPYDHIFGVHRASFAAVEALRSGERIDLT